MDISQITKAATQNAMKQHFETSSKNVTKAYSVAKLMEVVLDEEIDLDKDILQGGTTTIADLLGEIEEARTEQLIWEREKNTPEEA